MKRLLAIILTLSMLTMGIATASAAAFTPGDYEASAQGFGGAVTVKVTVDEAAVTAIEIVGDAETDGIGKTAIEEYAASLVGISSADGIDAKTGATITSEAVKAAVADALSQAAGTAASSDEALAFTAGTYTASAAGYMGDVTLDVTFSDSAVTDIAVTASGETEHVGDVVYDIMIPDIIAANGTGVDAVSGATFTSRAVRTAVNAAAEQAGCTNLSAFQANTIELTAQAPIEENYDVVIVGAGEIGRAHV